MTTTPDEPPTIDWGARYEAWSLLDKWSWLVASATPFARFPPAPESLEAVRADTFHQSADWRALVLRDGFGFVNERADQGDDDPYFAAAELYVRTIYLDALLLGETQRLSLGRLADELAALDNPIDKPRELERLEMELTRFRTVFWWHHVTSHGPANDLLTGFQSQHRLPQLFDQIVQELTDSARQAQTAAALRSNAMLAIVTVLGLPLGTALGVTQIFEQNKGLVLGVSVLLALVLSTLILSTATGRELIRPLKPNSRR